LPVAVLAGLRPRQWVKNALVFSAPAAAGALLEWETAWRACAAFALFSAAASSVYLLNDVLDREADRRHPRKRTRPVASGALPVPVALAVAAVLAAGSVGLVAVVRPLAAVLLAVYLGTSALYTVWIKHVAVYDLLVVASGFVLRAGVGAAMTDVPVSQWFLTVMAFGSLAMAAGKRSSELAATGGADLGTRRVLADYTPGFLLQVEAIAVGGALVGYSLWAFELAERSVGSMWLQLSVVPFAAALLRYLLMMSRGQAEAPEEAVFHDRALTVAAAVWVVLFGIGVGQ
jgi:decaprenyl-phosphate phosphoribosyltransferase